MDAGAPAWFLRAMVETPFWSNRYKCQISLLFCFFFLDGGCAREFIPAFQSLRQVSGPTNQYEKQLFFETSLLIKSNKLVLLSLTQVRLNQSREEKRWVTARLNLFANKKLDFHLNI